jgi:hypothetical protein
MDDHSTVDHSSALPAVEGDMPGSSASRATTASVSAGLSAANGYLPQPAEPGPRFPAEDGGRSLAEMAHRDLDAALQLLTERAQYITGASGAAIALRRGEHHDMLCRASAGSNAPELGALLSMEYGLSGESVRTRQALRCDDAERDPRVNREGCRQLGIASVVVMPVVSDEQVLGVFELFSGKPSAFDERDVSALQRLSEIVETAVKHAVAMQALSAPEEPAAAEAPPPVDVIAAETARVESPGNVMDHGLAPAPPAVEIPRQDLGKVEPEGTAAEESRLDPAPTPKKPLFWSAAMQTPDSGGRAAESIPVPPVLRNLQKCRACGFPVSQGRTFCVECEEKKWRGQRLPATGEPASGKAAVPAPAVAVTRTPRASAPIEAVAVAARTSAASTPDVPVDAAGSDNSSLFLSSSFLGSAAPSESWFAANKYILGALLVVAIVIGTIVWLR